jgi:hypothetical protein
MDRSWMFWDCVDNKGRRAASGSSLVLWHMQPGTVFSSLGVYSIITCSQPLVLAIKVEATWVICLLLVAMKPHVSRWIWRLCLKLYSVGKTTKHITNVLFGLSFKQIGPSTTYHIMCSRFLFFFCEGHNRKCRSSGHLDRFNTSYMLMLPPSIHSVVAISSWNLIYGKSNDLWSIHVWSLRMRLHPLAKYFTRRHWLMRNQSMRAWYLCPRSSVIDKWR